MSWPATSHSECGSSPRMRGKQRAPRSADPHMRIIPAHAGQTTAPHCSAMRTQDHPRACGANFSGADSSLIERGSSPRMRGKPGGEPIGAECRRIIPAHAGQTAGCHRMISSRSDHPRACGANSRLRQKVSRCRGSSPRMRGKLLLSYYRSLAKRIIPAHAGQTVRA